MENELALQLSKKLGVDTPRVLRKSQEYLRLADLKLRLSCLNFSGSCKTILCLDLAASSEKISFDKNMAVKLSGVTKKNYINYLQALEESLSLRNEVTIEDLCVQFGCAEVADLANGILESYETEMRSTLIPSRQADLDITKPLFVIAAVYAACRKSKIKIDRMKLMEVGKVKKSAFESILRSMDSHAVKIAGNNSRTKPPKSIMETVEEKLKGAEKKITSSKRTKANDSDDEVQDFSEWRKRILESAAKKLKDKHPNET